MTESQALTLAERLTTARRLRNLTQEELARRSGVPQPQISRLERGQTAEPSVFTVSSLAETLGVDLRLLLDTDADRFLTALLGEDGATADGESLDEMIATLAGDGPGREERSERELQGLLPGCDLSRAGERAVPIARLDDDSTLHFPLSALEGHLLLTGAPSSGVDDALLRLVCACAREDGGLLFLDADGTLSEKLVRILLAEVPERADDVLFADFADSVARPGFNPLDVRSLDEAWDFIELAGRHLFVPPGEKGEWPGRIGCTHALLGLAEANLCLRSMGARERFAASDVPQFFSDDELRVLVCELSGQRELRYFYDPDHGAFGRFDEKTRKRLGMRGPLLQRGLAHLCEHGRAMDALAAQRNGIADEIERGRIVVARLSGSPHEAPGGRLLAALIAAGLICRLRNQVNPESATPLRVVLTDAQNVLSHYPFIWPLVRESGRLGTQVILATRYLTGYLDSQPPLAFTESQLAFATERGPHVRWSLADGVDAFTGVKGTVSHQPRGSFYGDVAFRDDDGIARHSGLFHAVALEAPAGGGNVPAEEVSAARSRALEALGAAGPSTAAAVSERIRAAKTALNHILAKRLEAELADWER